VETSVPGREPVKDASKLVTELPTLRCAIAAFDTWADAQKALHALNAGGKALNDVSYLARQRALGDALRSNSREIVHLFDGTDGGICCSAGPVADRLIRRLGS